MPPDLPKRDLWGRILIAAMLLTGPPIAAQLAHALACRAFGS